MNGQPLTITLPQPDAEFLRAYAAMHKISIDEVIDRYVKGLIKERETPTAKSPIGLFSDRTQIIDAMMADVERTRALPLRPTGE